MFPNSCVLNKGFALPAAIFILVMVSAMITSMIRLSSSQNVGSTLGVMSSRAFWAAQTGLEWGANYVTTNNSCNPGFPTVLTVNEFSVAMTCAATSHDEEDYTLNHYEVTAVAVTTGLAVDNPDYVYKQLQATLIR